LLTLIPAIFAYSFYDSHSLTNAVDNAPDQQTPTQHLPSSRDHATTVVTTSRYSNGNHSSHRRAVTPMLRAIDYIRRPQRLEAFRVPWCQLHVPLKCPFLLGIQAGPTPMCTPNCNLVGLCVLHGSRFYRTDRSRHVCSNSLRAD